MSEASQEQYIRDFLRNDSQLRVLVGERIFATAPPSVEGSYIYFSLVAERTDTTLNELTGLVEAHYQFDCWSDDAQKARKMRERIKALFGPMSNNVISLTQQGATADIWDDNQRDLNAMVQYALTFCMGAPTPYG